MAHAILVVPPLLKYAAGPLLGPAMLAGAAQSAGHCAGVIDLNIAFLREHIEPGTTDELIRAYGDHARPPDGLRKAAERFLEVLAPMVKGPAGHRHRNAALTLPVSHDQVYAAAFQVAQSPFGAWVHRQLSQAVNEVPDMVGISVLYSGQVLAGLVATLAARAAWPGVPIFWGGPHVTALRDVIPNDPSFGHLVDGFVFGAAEQTFISLLDALDDQVRWPDEVVRAGSGRYCAAKPRLDAIPHFDALNAYGIPVLTLPAQTGRGCAYGQCTYCTYPAIEGSPVTLGLAALEQVVHLAERHGAIVSLKDSLLIPRRLEQVAACISDRVLWAGCTKLHPRLDRPFLALLARSGCRTLEFGLETLLPESQGLIVKHQTAALLGRVLDACASAAIHPVVNLITGFPGEDAAAAAGMVSSVQDLLVGAGGAGFGQVEHNAFELERLAPMAKDPRIEITGSWPWASVMDWRWRA